MTPTQSTPADHIVDTDFAIQDEQKKASTIRTSQFKNRGTKAAHVFITQ